jgi:cell division topological specificity factor
MLRKLLRDASKNFQGRFFGGESSKSQAKNRLQFVLVQDRAGLNNEELSQFKREMIAVIEKYFVIDESRFDISYQRATESTTLLINSPIIVRRQEGQKHIVGSKRQPKEQKEQLTKEPGQQVAP